LGLLLVVLIAAGASSAASPDANTPIYDIQYTTDPSGDSPLEGQVVTTTGVVYATYSAHGFCIADDTDAWHGIYVYYPSGGLPAIGDEVEVSGLVQEYYGLTELADYATYSILSSGNPVYTPTLVTAAQIEYDDSASEPYESVFVQLQNIEVTAGNDTHDIWTFTDASGGTGKADDWGYDANPDVGDTFATLQGALIYDYDEFKVMPREIGDAVEGFAIELLKAAPKRVTPGAVFTYTLTAKNGAGMELTQVVMTDALPANVEIATLSDGGVHLGGNVVSWSIASLADGAMVTRTAVVTAPSWTDVLINDDYVIWADNWPIPVAGRAVQTLVSEQWAIIPIHLIQGGGSTSPLNGYTDLLIEGIVVGDFQHTSDELGGFYLQEEDVDVDGDPATSEGIFVYDNGFGIDVAEGDRVRVQGDVNERDGQTELRHITYVQVYGSGLSVTSADIALPVDTAGYLERFEGMLVTSADDLYVTEHYNLARYGEVWVSVGARLYNPTHLTTPGAAANALQDLNDRSRLLIDDGSQISNPAVVPYLAADSTLRLGDSASGLLGALGEGSEAYRLQPVAPPTFTRANPRTTAPDDPGGTLKVASFNVLNYFNGDGLGGGFPTERGADTLEEFLRQRAKIITATVAMDADVIGLMEIENDGYGPQSAIQDLVNGLNDATAPGTYAFIDPGLAQVGTDAIAVGLIYKPAAATPVGDAQILDSSVDPTFIDTKNRPVLAQTFEHNATGERLTIAVNHLKSKGSSCNDVGDPDTGDGQGNCNLTRTSAATALVNWLAGDPTGSGDPDSLIIGDLNAYAMEDPITAIKNGGYTNLVEAYMGADAYSYVYAGQAGYLDHALANDSLAPQVAGATIWHINADEPRALDYQDYNPPYLYAPDAYRASDHDPVIVDLFSEAALGLAKEAAPATDVPLGAEITYSLNLANHGFLPASGVVLTDVLPVETEFSGWVTQSGAEILDGTITWSGDIPGGDGVTIVFAAMVTDDSAYLGSTITNTACFTSTAGGGGSASAVLQLNELFSIYLPIVSRGQP
jgi:uncharacterized repeat protein (TIGR01451 family)